MELVSIVIPVYNTGEPLRGCLDSVIQQTYPNLEIVVVDDQSSDPLTLDILQGYAAKDSRIKLVRNEKNSGLSFSRNAGVAQSTGKYLSFLDSDDKFALEFVERMVEALEKTHTELAMCHVQNYAEDKSLEFDPDMLKLKFAKPVVFNMQEFIKAGYMFMLPVVAYGKMMRLDVYKQDKMEFNKELRIWEDNEWFYRYVVQFKNVCTVDFVGVYRLVRSDSLSRKLDPSAIHALLKVYKLCHQALDQHGFLEQYHIKFLEFMIGSFNVRVEQVKDYASIISLTQEFISMLRQMGYPLSVKLSSQKSKKLSNTKTVAMLV